MRRVFVALFLCAGVAQAGPVITSITPAHGPTTGGTVISIAGSGFRNRQPSVTIGGLPCTVATSSDTNVTCAVPAGAGGRNVPVVLVAAGVPSNTAYFSYDAPSIAGVTPNPITCSAPAAITITGANFGTAATVTLDGRLMPISSQTHTSIVLNVGCDAGSTHPLQVQVVDQSAAANLGYAPPTITSVNTQREIELPMTAENETLKIIGTNLQGTSVVNVGASPCRSLSVSPTSISCITPMGSGRAPITVVAAGQTSAPFDCWYRKPSITNVYWAGGALAIAGSYFGSKPAVFVNGTACAASYGSNALICAWPQTTAKLTVTVVNGTDSSAPFAFQ